MSHIFTVAEITGAIKRALEGQFPFVWVKGQVSNLSRPASGHMYFSLKDSEAQLSCVWFRGNQRPDESFDPLTGEVYEDGPRPGLARTLKEGQEIMCAGRLNVYPPRGAYQLVVEIAQEAGLGELYLAFERLKKELGEKGYFAAGRKRALPYHPRNVAVVTAATGAALQDFLRIGGERGWGANIRIFPTLVQGDEAPPKIVEAMRMANADGWADVIVLIRGGGSIEDLWAFNDARVAEAVYSSPTPVLAGIGHEVDHTIADMTADVRAATPSHAAQLLWPDRAQLVQTVDELEMRLSRQWEQGIYKREQALGTLARGLAWLSPVRQIERWDERFVELSSRLERAWQHCASGTERGIDRLEERIVAAFGPPALDSAGQHLAGLTERLNFHAERMLTKHEYSLERLAMQLDALDPEKPLERGYSLVRKPDGTFLRDIHEVAKGDTLDILVRDGVVHTSVTGSSTREDS